MHAVPRLALNGAISNIQTSWVKMGREGAMLALQCGANDLGGSLMNESITRAAGAEHGQEWPLQRWPPPSAILDAKRECAPRLCRGSCCAAGAAFNAGALSQIINSDAESFRQASLWMRRRHQFAPPAKPVVPIPTASKRSAPLFVA